MVSKKFNFSVPVELRKTDEGDWRIRGLASTEGVDLQGEVVKQDGLDISALQQGFGLFNFDHEKGPENLIGAIDKAEKSSNGLMVEGYLFKHQPRAVAFYNVLNSLKEKDRHRVKMSIEGKIIKRAGDNGKIIANAKVDKVALTVDPVNTETYVEICKSLSAIENGSEDVEDSKPVITDNSRLRNFIKLRILFKALQAGIGYTGAPSDMSGGGVLTSESLDREIKDLKSLDDSDEFKSLVTSIAKKVSDQFPHASRYTVLKSVVSKVRELTK